jgi:hypothetical protein
MIIYSIGWKFFLGFYKNLALGVVLGLYIIMMILSEEWRGGSVEG